MAEKYISVTEAKEIALAQQPDPIIQSAICSVLDNAPGVDVAPVVHSTWDTVFFERNLTIATYSHLCPKCKYFYRGVRFKGHDFCPGCGADMRGADDGKTE